MSKAVLCEGCKCHLGELAAGSTLRRDALIYCAKCAPVVTGRGFFEELFKTTGGKRV